MKINNVIVKAVFSYKAFDSSLYYMRQVIKNDGRQSVLILFIGHLELQLKYSFLYYNYYYK